jgi:hypothetical protein
MTGNITINFRTAYSELRVSYMNNSCVVTNSTRDYSVMFNIAVYLNIYIYLFRWVVLLISSAMCEH